MTNHTAGSSTGAATRNPTARHRGPMRAGRSHVRSIRCEHTGLSLDNLIKSMAAAGRTKTHDFDRFFIRRWTPQSVAPQVRYRKRPLPRTLLGNRTPTTVPAQRGRCGCRGHLPLAAQQKSNQRHLDIFIGPGCGLVCRYRGHLNRYTTAIFEYPPQRTGLGMRVF